MSDTQTVRVTPEHIQLVRRFIVGWQDAEYGAPEINPKRPYGNSSVENDIHEILTGESIGCVGDSRDELTESECAHYARLHRETETVLQIVLATGLFEAGTYECSRYGTDWRKVSA